MYLNIPKFKLFSMTKKNQHDKVYFLYYYFNFKHVHHLLDKSQNDLIHCDSIDKKRFVLDQSELYFLILEKNYKITQ